MDLTISELLEILKRSPLTDIYVPGFIDDGGGDLAKSHLPEGGRQFHPMTDNVYLELGDRLLRIRAPEDRGRMRVEPAERIECSFELDPDDTFGVVSVLRSKLVSTRATGRVLRLDVFLGEACNLDRCIFASLGLMLDGDDYIFFDPLDYDGIRIGGARARDAWIAAVFDGYSMKWYSMDRA
jgi:hypothetical protein